MLKLVEVQERHGWEQHWLEQLMVCKIKRKWLRAKSKCRRWRWRLVDEEQGHRAITPKPWSCHLWRVLQLVIYCICTLPLSDHYTHLVLLPPQCPLFILSSVDLCCSHDPILNNSPLLHPSMNEYGYSTRTIRAMHSVMTGKTHLDNFFGQAPCMTKKEIHICILLLVFCDND